MQEISEGDIEQASGLFAGDAAAAVNASDPAKVADARRLSRRYDVPQSTVGGSFADFMKAERRDASADALAAAPGASAYMAQNPEVAPVFQGDEPKFGPLESSFTQAASEGFSFGKVWDDVKEFFAPSLPENRARVNPLSGRQAAIRKAGQSRGLTAEALDNGMEVGTRAVDGYRAGVIQSKQAELWNRAREERRGLSDEEAAQNAAWEKELKDLQGRHPDSSWFEAGTVTGQMIDSITERPDQAALAALSTGVMLGGMGVFAPAAIGGVGAVSLASYLGLTTMSMQALATYRQEAGGMYQSLIEQGEKPERAALWSGFGGMVNSLIEQGGFKALGAAATPLTKDLVTKWIGTNSEKYAASLVRPTYGSVLKDAAKAYGSAVFLTEPGEEVLQEITSVAVEEASKTFGEGHGDTITSDQLMERLWGIYKKTAQAMSVLGAVGGLPLVGHNIRMAERSARTQRFFQGLSDFVKSSEAMKRDPEAVRDMISDQAAKQGASTVYVDGQAFTQAMADARVTEEDLRRVAPDVAAQLEEARATGGDVLIETGEYAQKIAGTAFGERLNSEVRLHQEDLSASEAKKARSALKEVFREEIKAKEDGRGVGLGEFGQTMYKRFAGDLTRANEDLGVYTGEQIRTQARMAARMSETLVRYGLKREQVEHLAPKIVSSVQQAKRHGGALRDWVAKAEGTQYVHALSLGGDRAAAIAKATGREGLATHVQATAAFGERVQDDVHGFTDADVADALNLPGEYTTLYEERARRGARRVILTRERGNGDWIAGEFLQTSDGLLRATDAVHGDKATVESWAKRMGGKKSGEQKERVYGKDETRLTLDAFGEGGTQRTGGDALHSYIPTRRPIKGGDKVFEYDRDEDAPQVDLNTERRDRRTMRKNVKLLEADPSLRVTPEELKSRMHKLWEEGTAGLKDLRAAQERSGADLAKAVKSLEEAEAKLAAAPEDKALLGARDKALRAKELAQDAADSARGAVEAIEEKYGKTETSFREELAEVDKKLAELQEKATKEVKEKQAAIKQKYIDKRKKAQEAYDAKANESDRDADGHVIMVMKGPDKAHLHRVPKTPGFQVVLNRVGAELDKARDEASKLVDALDEVQWKEDAYREEIEKRAKKREAATAKWLKKHPVPTEPAKPTLAKPKAGTPGYKEAKAEYDAAQKAYKDAAAKYRKDKAAQKTAAKARAEQDAKEAAAEEAELLRPIMLYAKENFDKWDMPKKPALPSMTALQALASKADRKAEKLQQALERAQEKKDIALAALDTAFGDADLAEKRAHYTALSKTLADRKMKLEAKIEGLELDAKADIMSDQVASNLEWIISLIPDDIRERAKQWYDGGRRMVQAWHERYGISRATAAGVIACLSPQKDWFTNVSMAERIFDIYFGMRDFRWDQRMTDIADRGRYKDEKGVEHVLVATPPMPYDNYPGLRKAIQGKTLGEVIATGDPVLVGAWIRVYDQTYNDKSFAVLSPEGGAYGTFKKADGTGIGIRWQSYSAIGRAVACIMDPSLVNISTQVGGMHKVRNFVNNLLNPEWYGPATIDTHAVAAALIRALSSASVAVSRNFGSSGAAGSGKLGLKGTYPFFLEGYQKEAIRAEQRYGIRYLPREIQSMSWEGIRVLFTDTLKRNPKAVRHIEELWLKWKKGEATIEKTRQAILDYVDSIEHVIDPKTGKLKPEKFTWGKTKYNRTVGETYNRKNVKLPADLTRGGLEVHFEVAPNPDNVELQKRWDAIAPADRERISLEVATDVVRQVMRDFDADYSLIPTVGGFEGNTNISFTLLTDSPQAALRIADVLGYVLSQKGMCVVDKEPRAGLSPTNAAVIRVPPAPWAKNEKGNRQLQAAKCKELYDRLAKEKVTCKDPDTGMSVTLDAAGGFSTELDADGNMTGIVILNFGAFGTQEIADKIKAVLSAVPEFSTYEVSAEERYTAWPEAENNGYNLEGDERADYLRRKATAALEEKLSAAEGRALPAAREAGEARGSSEEGAGAGLGDGRGAAENVAAPTEARQEVAPPEQALHSRDPHIGDKQDREQVERTKDRGLYYPEENIIVLTPNADMTTFAHELSHAYLTQIVNLAVTPDCPEQIRKDARTVLKAGGFDSVEAYNAAPFEARRKLQEWFAYQSEIYLSTGTVETESDAVRGFFRRFGAYVRNVYRAWKGGAREALGILFRDEFGEELGKPSPEVEGVLKRMWMSEREYDAAEEAAGLQPLFRERPGGMDEEAWKLYQYWYAEAKGLGVDRLQATALGQMRWLSRARGKILAGIQRKYREYRLEARDKMAEQVYGLPSLGALYDMKHGLTTVDAARHTKLVEAMIESGLAGEGKAPQKSYKGLKFDAEELLDAQDAGVLTQDKIELLKGMGLVAKDAKNGALPMDQLAALVGRRYGAPTGLQLIDLLLTAPKDPKGLVEDMTDQYMLEKHSNLKDPKYQEEQVIRALATEAREHFVEAELKYFGSRTNGRVLRAAAKLAAQELVDKTLAEDCDPKKYHALAARANRRAFEALRKHDMEAALAAKRDELLNLQCARVALDAQEDYKRLRALRKAVYAGDKDLAKKRDLALVQGIRAVFAQVGLGKGDEQAPLDYLEKVKAYDPATYDAVSQMIAPWRTAPSFEYLTVAQARELSAAVRGMWEKSREEKLLDTGEESVQFADVVTALTARINETGELRAEGVAHAYGRREKLSALLLHTKAIMARVETWCIEMDDGKRDGIFTKYIFRPLSRASADYRLAYADYLEKYLKLLHPAMKRWSKCPAIAAPEIGYTFETKAELIGALLHTGNMSNKTKLLLGGRGVTQWARVVVDEETGKEHIDTSAWDGLVRRLTLQGVLTKEDFDFCQGVWDVLESTKPLAQKAYKKIYGRYFEEIKAQEFTVLFPDGTTKTYRGGYVPATTDPRLVAEARIQDDIADLASSSLTYMMPITQPGFTQSRLESYNKPLLLDAAGLGRHIAKVLQLAYIYPAAAQTQRIFKDREFADALAKKDREAMKDMLLPWLKRVTAQTISDGDAGGPWSAKLSALRTLAALNIMALNLPNALQQITGLSIAMTLAKPRTVARATARFFRHPKKIVAEISALSPFMRSRFDDRGFEFSSMLEQYSKGGRLTKTDDVKTWIKGHAYILQSLMQIPVDAATWMAVYEETVENGKPSEAIAQADAAVRRTQSSFNAEDIASVEAGSAYTRVFLVFYNYFNMQWNLLHSEGSPLLKTKQYGRFIYLVTMAVYLPGLLSQWITDAFKSGSGDDDDDEAFWLKALRTLIGTPVKSMLPMIPMAGSLVSTAGQYAASKGLPVFNLVWDPHGYANDRMVSVPALQLIDQSTIKLMDAYLKYFDSGDVTQAIRRTADTLSLIFGVPLAPAAKPAAYAAGLAQGKYKAPESPMDVVRGVVTGRGDTE